MLNKAPYSEYTSKNLQNLQKMQKAKLEKMNIKHDELMNLDGSHSSQSMNATYIIKKEKKLRYKNQEPENLESLNSFMNTQLP